MADDVDELAAGAVRVPDCAGCPVELVDAAGILAAAEVGRVQLAPGGAFPPPVRRVRFWVAPAAPIGQDGRRGYFLDAEIESADAADGDERPGLAVLGNDPIGVLLARRLAAGDPWAARLVDGADRAVAGAYRRLGRGRPGGPGTRRPGAPVRDVMLEHPEAGLRATVTHRRGPAVGGHPAEVQITAVRATVPADGLTPARLRAMFCLVLHAVGELGGPGAAAPGGRRYALALRPAEDGAGDAAGSLAHRPGRPPAAEPVGLDQVGGLPAVVAQFREIAVSFRHPQVMARWGARRPQGILLYGPPGTGKTMLAKALAAEIGATFKEIRTPEILDKWLGGSERNIKRIFQEARRYREPTVLLFDEFDSIISYAGAGGDAASQAVNAVAGIFKQEMNTLIEENPNVIVVATTNFPDRVDESLIRSGRFDIKIAIPRPDETGRAEILRTMIHQLVAAHEGPGFRMFADDVDARELARLSPGLTGADIKEALRRVQLNKAMQEARSGAAAPPISQEDLLRGLGELRRVGAVAH